MARGWESKAVESQVEDRSRERQRRAGPVLDAGGRARLERRRTLELARARMTADLARAVAPAHRQMLEAAVLALEEELHVLDRGGR